MTCALKLRLIVSLLIIIFVNNVNSRRKQEFGQQLGGLVHQQNGNSYHNALLQKLNLLIPNMKTKKPQSEQLQLLQNLLQMIKFLALKLRESSTNDRHNSRLRQYSILRSTVDEALQNIKQSGSADENVLNRIANQLAQLFQETPKVTTNMVAPFCEPGNDCFLDVNHGRINGAVKNLAYKVSSYIKTRRRQFHTEEANLNNPIVKAQLKADRIIADSTVLLGQLHRSIMRNWHHILMILGNLVGSNGGSIHLLGNPTPPQPNKFQRMGYINQPNEMKNGNNYDDGLGNFQCKVEIKGNPKEDTDKTACSSRKQPWFKNDDCPSPIKRIKNDCSPSLSGGKFEQLKGVYVFVVAKEGFWHYSLKLQLESSSNSIEKDSINGRIDRIKDEKTLPESLMEINNDIHFDKDYNKHPRSVTVVQEGSAYFLEGDGILLRLAKTKSDMTVVFAAEFVGLNNNESQYTHGGGNSTEQNGETDNDQESKAKEIKLENHEENNYGNKHYEQAT